MITPMNNYTKLSKLIADYCVIDTSEIKLNAYLRKDIGLDGDDAIEFFLLIEKEFEVNCSEFSFSDYFHGEGISIKETLKFFFTSNKKQYKDLKISDLLYMIESKKFN